MPERMLTLLWGIEKDLKWAANIQAACEAFEHHTSRPATHALVSPSAPAPPAGCPLQWRVTITVQPTTLLVGCEVLP